MISRRELLLAKDLPSLHLHDRNQRGTKSLETRAGQAENPLKVIENLVETPARGDGGGWLGGALQIRADVETPKVSQSRVGGLEAPLGSWGAPGSAGVGRRLIFGALTHVFVLG